MISFIQEKAKGTGREEKGGRTSKMGEKHLFINEEEDLVSKETVLLNQWTSV